MASGIAAKADKRSEASTTRWTMVEGAAQARRQDFAAGVAKSHKGGTFFIFLIQCWMYAATATKKVACGV